MDVTRKESRKMKRKERRRKQNFFSEGKNNEILVNAFEDPWEGSLFDLVVSIAETKELIYKFVSSTQKRHLIAKVHDKVLPWEHCQHKDLARRIYILLKLELGLVLSEAEKDFWGQPEQRQQQKSNFFYHEKMRKESSQIVRPILQNNVPLPKLSLLFPSSSQNSAPHPTQRANEKEDGEITDDD